MQPHLDITEKAVLSPVILALSWLQKLDTPMDGLLEREVEIHGKKRALKQLGSLKTKQNKTKQLGSLKD